MTYPRPVAVVLAFEDQEFRQNYIAETIRQNFSELIGMKPMERKARIDELLKPKERTNERP